MSNNEIQRYERVFKISDEYIGFIYKGYLNNQVKQLETKGLGLVDASLCIQGRF